MAVVVGFMKGPWDAEDKYDEDKWKAAMKAENDAVDQLAAASAALPEGEVVGGLLHFPIGDGRALYVVVKAKPLQLKHVPAHDAYQASPLTIRGLRLADVQRMLDQDRRMAKLFAEQRAKRT